MKALFALLAVVMLAAVVLGGFSLMASPEVSVMSAEMAGSTEISTTALGKPAAESALSPAVNAVEPLSPATTF